MDYNILILLQLLLAHVLTDFVFQNTKMVKHKRNYKGKSWYLYAHSILAGVLSYVFLQDWGQVLVPIIIIVTHFFIDLWKLNQSKDNLKYFIIDQILHLLIITITWLYLIDGFSSILPAVSMFFSSTMALAILIGYLIVIFPVGFIIGKATERWQYEVAKEGAQNSLKKAGRYIGIFERILVLTFILINNFAAIGFLIGAKSILRFSDTKGARKQTEYVLIGTLMSFAICIVIGLVIRYFVFR